jgi:hypothetical protein
MYTGRLSENLRPRDNGNKLPTYILAYFCYWRLLFKFWSFNGPAFRLSRLELRQADYLTLFVFNIRTLARRILRSHVISNQTFGVPLIVLQPLGGPQPEYLALRQLCFDAEDLEQSESRWLDFHPVCQQLS